MLCAQKWRDSDTLIPMHLLCAQKWRDSDRLIPTRLLCVLKWRDSDRLIPTHLLCAQKWRDSDTLIPTHLLCVQKWRELIERFKDKVEDYNYGSLLRLDSSQGYTQENSTFCEHKFSPSSAKEFNELSGES